MRKITWLQFIIVMAVTAAELALVLPYLALRSLGAFHED